MQAHLEKERQLLRVALHCYGRCQAAGDMYDLPVVFRLVQLWFQ